MSSPWNKYIVPKPVSLQDVMLEELTNKLQEKENRNYGVFAFSTHEEFNIPEKVSQNNKQLKSDEEFAKMLQQHYQELCIILENDKINSASVLPYSHDPQYSLNFDLDSDNEELEDVRDKNEWDKFGTVLQEFDPIPADNCKCDKRKIVRKSNTPKFNNQTICKTISFPWTYVPGAARIETKKLPLTARLNYNYYTGEPYYIYNGLYYSYENPPEEEEKPIFFGIDHKTKTLLYKMIKIQLLKQINGLISVGEDALILQAQTNLEYESDSFPRDYAIKIFKTTLEEPKRKHKSITEEYRFNGIWQKSGELDILKSAYYWAQQERQILQKLQRAGISCPEVITFNRNILVMSCLNSDTSNKPAPKLRDAEIDLIQMANAYKQVVHYMKVMFTECNLIHGDLSATNILWCNNKCYIIDVSRCVRRTHEKALQLLCNDCESISNFFIEKCISNVATPEELFKDITNDDPRNRFIWAEYQKCRADIKPDIKAA